MSEKRFSETERNCYYTSLVFDNQTQEELGTNKSVKLLNALHEENEQLRKQIQNYEQLISNSYVGEEETLDGFVGKYVIWEDELQKYKNKNEMIDDG